MNFGLTPEQEMVVSTVRGFVETELYPLEAGGRARRPRAARNGARDPATRCMALGFYAAEHSGRARRRRARYSSPSRCSSASSAAPAGRLPCISARPSNILMACNGEQRERYLLPAIRGEKIDALAMTEPDAGSDVRSMKMHARGATARDWVLNGTKHFISHADAADFVIVFAATGEEETAAGAEEADHRLPGRPRHAGLRHPPRLRLGLASAATTTRS